MSSQVSNPEQEMNRIEDFNIHVREKYHYPDVYAQRFFRGTACAESKGTICSAVGCEQDGIQQILVQLRLPDGTVKEHRITGGMPTMPALAAGDDGSFRMVYVNFTDDLWQVCLAVITQDAVSVTVLHTSEMLCHQTAICRTETGFAAAWNGVTKDGKFAIHLYDSRTAFVSVLDEAENCYRPALAADETRLFAAYDMEGSSQCAVLRVLQGDQTERYVLAETGEDYYSCALAVQNGECGLAAVSLRLARDADRDICDHSSQICFWNWTKDGFGGKEIAANLDEGLLGKRVYVPYFGVRRRCMLLTGEQGYSLFFEKRFEHEREDVNIDYDPNKLCYEHYGYLIRKNRVNGAWSAAEICHEGGSCYSLACGENGTIASGYLLQHNVFELPKFCQGFLSGVDRKPLDETYENPNFELAHYQAERVASYKRGEQTLYWGDTHVHSICSPDAEGESDMLMRYARDVAALDFVALVDNDYYPHTGLTPVDFERQKAIARTLSEDGTFLAIPAIEFTCHENRLEPNFNHRYVMHFGDADYCSRTFPETRNVQEMTKAMDGQKVIIVAHHPHWDLAESSMDQFVEICSSWRISMEEKNFILQALARHQKFAFIGSSDTHRAVGGMGGALTGVYADSLTPDGMYHGYLNRATIASQGLKIAIDFTAGGGFIGEEVVSARNPLLQLRVESPEDLEFVEVIRDGIAIARFEDPGRSLSRNWVDDDAGTGEHFYYVRVKAYGEESLNEPDSVKDQPSGPFIRTGRYPFNFARARGPYAWCTPVWLTIS